MKPEEEAEEQEFFRWYGHWAPMRPSDVAAHMGGISVPWWIVGGWAVDAFSGEPRDHDDVDVAFFRGDLAAVHAHLSPTLCIWSNLGGTLRPLKRPEDLLEGARQLWVRADADGPWLLDLAMTPHEGDTWISVRDDRLRVPLDEATFRGDGDIRYLRPEIVLHQKARLHRSKDERDLNILLPRLDAHARAWLRDALEMTEPEHPWLERVHTAA